MPYDPESGIESNYDSLVADVTQAVGQLIPNTDLITNRPCVPLSGNIAGPIYVNIGVIPDCVKQQIRVFNPDTGVSQIRWVTAINGQTGDITVDQPFSESPVPGKHLVSIGMTRRS